MSYGLLGMLNWAYKWYDPQGRFGIGEVAEHFTSLALAGLAAAQPRAPRAGRRAPPGGVGDNFIVKPLGFDKTGAGG